MIEPGDASRMPGPNRVIFWVAGIAAFLWISGPLLFTRLDVQTLALGVAAVIGVGLALWIRRQPRPVLDTSADDQEEILFFCSQPMQVDHPWSAGGYYVFVTPRRVVTVMPPNLQGGMALHYGPLLGAGGLGALGSQLVSGVRDSISESLFRYVDWAAIGIGAVVGYVIAQDVLFRILNPDRVRFQQALRPLELDVIRSSSPHADAARKAKFSSSRLMYLSGLGATFQHYTHEDVTSIDTRDAISITTREGTTKFDPGHAELTAQLRLGLDAFWDARAFAVRSP